MHRVTFNMYADTSTYRVLAHMNRFSDKNDGSDGDPPRQRIPRVEGSARAERLRPVTPSAEQLARDMANSLLDNIAARRDRDKYTEDLGLEVRTANDDPLRESDTDRCYSDAAVWDSDKRSPWPRARRRQAPPVPPEQVGASPRVETTGAAHRLGIVLRRPRYQ